jgi:hypothetical protein
MKIHALVVACAAAGVASLANAAAAKTFTKARKHAPPVVVTVHP